MNTRAIAKHRIRQQIIHTAMQRFIQDGFEATTIDSIAVDMGMSTRNFFRYFPSKEDLLLEPTQLFNQQWIAFFKLALPANDLWTALQIAMTETLASCKAQAPAYSEEIQGLIQASPALLARQLAHTDQLQVEIAQLYRSESSSLAMDFTVVHAIVGSAFACLQAYRRSDHGASQPHLDEDALLTLMECLRPAAVSKLAKVAEKAIS